MTASARSDLVCVAAIAAAHGVRGAMKLRCFTEQPENVANYGPLLDEKGNRLFEVRVIGPCKGGVIVTAEGIADRNAAEALRGQRLYVLREHLPALEEDEFFYEDLVGLKVDSTDGKPLGEVKAVQDFGAGDLIEVRTPEGEEFFLPFTSDVVLDIDLSGGRIVAAPPEALLPRQLAAALAGDSSGDGR